MFNKYEVYTESGSVYCYKDSKILRNKFNIRNFDGLKRVETDITIIKQNYMLTNPISGKFTTNHLCRIHEFLFEDIYRFAGHFRKEAIKKGDTTFLNEKDISTKMKLLCNKLKSENYLATLSFDSFIDRLAYYFSELNYIHPFREGNGRATREFIRQLALYNGYDVNWGLVEVDNLLKAMIDSVYNTTSLASILKICIKKGG